MTSGSLARAAGLGGAVFALSTLHTAGAIIIRHDVSDAEYVVSDEDYPALVDLFEPGDCIGTLITERVLLSVAHCAEDLWLSDTLIVDGSAVGIETITLHPDWDGWDNDIALIELSEPVEDIEPYSIYTGSDEQGQTITLVGRGVTATGLEGKRGADSDGKLRQATNVITTADSQWLEIDFEEPSEFGITALEGVGAAGDSGCPGFLDVSGVPVIAGLNSWGDGGMGIGVGEYGAQDYQTRVSQFAEWIADEVGSEVGTPGGEDANAGDNYDATEPETQATCGCRSSAASMGWPVVLLTLMMLLRRRSMPADPTGLGWQNGGT